MSSDNRLIAARYVSALFELASEGKQHDAIKADMLALKSVLDDDGAFESFLTNPVLSREQSQKTIDKVLSAIRASDLTKKLFALLTRNRRLALTSLVIDAYLERLAKDRGELTAYVTTAKAMGKEEMQTLSGTIAKSTGKKVTIKAKEDPALIGGLQVRIGSKMLDNSVAGKLQRLKQSLTKVA